MIYGQLIGDRDTDGSLKHWVNSSQLPSIVIVRQAEQFLYRRLRLREMLTTATGTLAADADHILLTELPRWRGPRFLTFTGIHQQEIKQKLLEDVERAFEYDHAGARIAGKPEMYYPAADRLQMERPATEDYPWRAVYYQELAPLTSTNQENVLTGKAIDCLVFACLMYCAIWIKNVADREYYLKLALNEIGELNVENDEALAGMDLDVMVV